jgi:hypothetical protein
MPDISAVANMNGADDNLEGKGTVQSVTVLSTVFSAGGAKYGSISELGSYFGTADYTGNTYALLSDIVAANALGKAESLGFSPLETTVLFDDVYDVVNYDANVELYVHAFKKDGLLYTFYTQARTADEFVMYSIEAGADE